MTLSFPTRRSSDLDYLWLGLFLLAAGNVFFEFASVNYNAMLNEISTPRTVGRVSGLGWGLGYIGGIVLLLLVYFGLINPEVGIRSEEHTSELQSLMRISYAVFCLKKKKETK